jgi:hypothetical protein
MRKEGVDMTRQINPCKLIKEQLIDDITYAMAVSRRTKKETGWPICELPKEKQWVAGYRRVGGFTQIETVDCHELPKINGRHMKQVGSFHVHPPKSTNEQSVGDAAQQYFHDEKLSCIGAASEGTMACYRPLSKSEANKISNLEDKMKPQNAVDFSAFEWLAAPTMERARVCEIQISKIGKLTGLKERIRKPKKPPLRF